MFAFPSTLTKILNNLEPYEEYKNKNFKITDTEKLVEINGNVYNNGWYSNTNENDSNFKVKFNKNNVTCDDDLTTSMQKNSLKFLPNTHFINITKCRLFKVE